MNRKPHPAGLKLQKTPSRATLTAMNTRDLLREGMSRLSEAHVPSHALAAELLLIYTLGRDRAWIYSHPEMLIEPVDAGNYFAFIARRAAGEPTQYIIGKQEFWGLEFEVNPSVLIPRPETEHVVEVALKRLSSRRSEMDYREAAEGPKIRIADVGTGSGCVAIALAKERPSAEIVATDISSAALELARRNAVRHSIASRIEFMQTDLLSALLHPDAIGGRPEPRDSQIATHRWHSFGLIVSNPPYIARDEAATLEREIREHEPGAALFGGPSGTEIYDRLIEQAGMLLDSGGNIVLELGYNSAPHVASLLESAAWRRVEITNDLAGIPRVIAAERA